MTEKTVKRSTLRAVHAALCCASLLLASCSRSGTPGLAGAAVDSAKADAAGSSAAEGGLLSRDDAVKHARVEVAHRDPSAVRAAIYARVADFGGVVVEEHWSDSARTDYSGSIEIRLPSSRFLPMVEWLRSEFHPRSLHLYAREADRKADAGAGLIDASGTVHSTIDVEVERLIGFRESFAIGLEGGGEALKASLRTIVPVISFLLPYAALVIAIIILAKLARKGLRKQDRRDAGRSASAPGPDDGRKS